MSHRIGHGYDVHAFRDGDHVMLGGVRIAHERGIDAHSDGDVVLHALCDALLGALALGDIGQHFPPTDARWKDCDSRVFVRHCAVLLAERGWHVSNADITVLAEAPRIGPHREAMRAADRAGTRQRNRAHFGQGDHDRKTRLRRPRRGPGCGGRGPDRPDLAMSELPFAHGGAPLRGRLRAEIADFFVDEQLGFEASGSGEHWLVHIEKRGANTGFVAKQLAAFAGVGERDVGYAGMKDRHAVTRQSFSVLAKKGREADWAQCAIEGVSVLSAQRHARKVQRGALRGNAFVIRLREVTGDRDLAVAAHRRDCSPGRAQLFR